MSVEFQPWPKIARLHKPMTITEKIDGTNACVRVVEDPRLGRLLGEDALGRPAPPATAVVGDFVVLAGSRKRWVTPREDNFGFATWVWEHALELVELGPGTHYGEWWGSGIQRGYGLLNGERRFSLFNTKQWNAETPPPECCSVVPVIYDGPRFNTDVVELIADGLQQVGSYANPGFLQPEGIMIYLHGPGIYLKYPFDK